MSDMSEYGMGMTGNRTPPLEETRGYREALATSADATGFDEVVTTELPIVDIEQLPTQTGMESISVPYRLPPPVVEDWTVDQPTWMLPVIPGPRRADNYAPGNAKAGSDTQGYLSLALDMMKSSGIYALGAVASPLISLVLTPFLTRNLSSTEYGSFAVLNTVIALVTAITQLGLIPAFFRAYNGDYDSPRDRSGVLSATIILLSLVTIPIGIAMMITAPWLSEFLFKSPSFSGSVRFTALVIILQNLTVPGISWLRAEKRAVLYSALSIANLLLVLITTIVLVGVLHTGVSGALLAQGVGLAAIVVCTLPIMLLRAGRQQSLHLRSDIVRNLLSFGVPTIFSDMAAWVLQVSDRYLLSLFGSLAQTASYSVAYSLGGVLAPLVLSPFGLAWVPVRYAVAKREDATDIFRLVFRWWSIVLLFAAFALSLLSTLVLEVLFPPAYHSAEPIIPIIALSTLFLGIYYIFSTGIYIRRKTVFTILFMSIAASVNLLLNIFFIPRFGAMGAAVSTLLAYVALVLVTYIVNQKMYPIRFEIGRFIIGLCVGIALYVGSSLLAHTQRPVIGWSISIGTIILYGVFLMLLGGLTAKKLKKTFSYVREALSKKGSKT
jgi:O-antigen/teichoic acid export membrane protein